jgi:hypothetical protein
MTKLFSFVLAAIVGGLPQVSHAQGGTSAEIAAIRAEIAVLMQRLDRLEQGDAGSAPSVQPEAQLAQRVVALEQAAGVSDRIELSGDFRYRHESINDDASVERHRQRIRARVGLDAAITEDIEFGLVLATGGDNPVSGNQSLEGGFTRKSIGIDRAFVDWSVNDRVNISAGKMRNPFFRPGGHYLIWDSDANPEGLALSYDTGTWFANIGSFWVEERSGSDESLLLGSQFGQRGSFGNDMRYTVGVSYLDYRNTQGQTPFYDDSGQGNRLNVAGNYLNDFNNVELFGQVDMTLGQQPLRLFADYVENTEGTGADTGFAFGAFYGDMSGRGTWEFGYAYQDLQADAVIATFTDSDFAGGGTDGKGHVFEFGYGLADRWSLGVTYFLNERGADAGNERDYNRLQADINFRY